jgi:hypothetical protein
MTEIAPDPVMGRRVALDPDEVQRATFRPDAGIVVRDAAALAVLGGGVVAGLFWWLAGVPLLAAWIAAAAAVGVRAAVLRSEVMAAEWRLTDRRLIGPGGRVVPLARVALVRRLWGDVQVVTQAGDKHLIRHQADAAGVVAGSGAPAAAPGRGAAR